MTIAAVVGEKVQYALEGSVFVAGAAIQWLRDEMKMIPSAADSEHYCLAVPDTGGVYLVPAFTGLGAPYWDPYARGILVGITRGTTRDHVVRATVESLAYQVHDLVGVMGDASGMAVNSLKVDGGASANNFLMQFQSDLLRAPVYRPRVYETTALGAAYLAGLAVEYYRDLDEIRENWQVGQQFDPALADDEAQHLIRGWKKAVACSVEIGRAHV